MTKDTDQKNAAPTDTPKPIRPTLRLVKEEPAPPKKESQLVNLMNDWADQIDRDIQAILNM